MKADTKRDLEKKARQFVIDNYSIDVVGAHLEEIIDNMPEIDWDFNREKPLRNPSYNPPNVESHTEWLMDMYINILKFDKITPEDKGLQGWLMQLNQGRPRQDVLNVFRQVAFKENQEMQKLEFEDLLDNTEKKRLAIVISGEEENVYLANSLIEGLKNKYSTHDIYAILKPEYFDLIESNPYLHKCIPFSAQLENPLILEGAEDFKGYFDIAYYPETTLLQNKIFHNAQD